MKGVVTSSYLPNLGLATVTRWLIHPEELRIDMSTTQSAWSVELAAEFGHKDVTRVVQSVVSESGVKTGIAVVQVVGSTGAVTTIEYESGALSDLRAALDKLAPTDASYEHNARWGDGNGFSHVRSALLKTAISIPIIDGRLALGTWQQIVALNLDNRARSREIVTAVIGD